MSFSKRLDDGTYIGEVPGITEGTFFISRRQLYDKGLHRVLQRGIAPHGSSVVISGGYTDNVDDGKVIIYTGEGGRDQSTNKQIRDQKFSGGNKHLAENHLKGIPVRVHRSINTHDNKKNDTKSPAGFRYRYDGLYRVADCWEEKGKEGFNICRFRLEKIATDSTTETRSESSTPIVPAGNTSPQRKESYVMRIVRESDKPDYVKKLYDYTCQICHFRLTTPRGAYAEGCHIKPLGRPHDGPDEVENILCLCPNCHVLFDEHAVWIDEDFKILGAVNGSLKIHPRHKLNTEYFKYHRTLGGH